MDEGLCWKRHWTKRIYDLITHITTKIVWHILHIQLPQQYPLAVGYLQRHACSQPRYIVTTELCLNDECDCCKQFETVFAHYR